MDFKSVWTSTMVPPEDLPFDVKSKLPMVYTQFRKTVESECEIKPICDVPRLLPLPPDVEPGELPTVEELCNGASAETDTRGVLPFSGGSAAGSETTRCNQRHWIPLKTQRNFLLISALRV